eukprot:TRINITY_DN50382_c0_g1_i1.p1 TRINITY_DN50382_c0_g1~~TRINITY_DN50382_c0_g1_i1.p1  ORF type:complete len:112 (-),score=33.72 TRINITY_DN50382_c0_g1_i1:13-318(-)
MEGDQDYNASFALAFVGKKGARKQAKMKLIEKQDRKDECGDGQSFDAEEDSSAPNVESVDRPQPKARAKTNEKQVRGSKRTRAPAAVVEEEDEVDSPMDET